MPPDEERGSEGLRLRIDRQLTILEAAGDPSLAPVGLEELVGRNILDLVHPIDRPGVEAWLGGPPGRSPAFRRVEIEEPPRWYRLLAVSGGGEETRELLFEDVTEEIREEGLRHRIMEILARFRGDELLRRIPSLAVELVGGDCGCLLDLHGPLAVVRSVSGTMGIGGGSAMVVAGTPLEAIPAREVVTYEGRLSERFPRSAIVRSIGAESAVVVPVQPEEDADPIAAILVLVRGQRRFTEWERGLLRMLGFRAGVELSGRERGETGVNGQAAMGRAAMTRLLGAQGAMNAFGNLLAAIGLNSELALGEADISDTLRVRLERIVDSVLRGRKLVRFVDLLSAPMRETPSPVALERIVSELEDLVPLCAEGLELATSIPEDGPRVWAAEGTLLALLATLLLAAADSIPRGVKASITRGDPVPTPAGPMVPLLVQVHPRVPEMPENAWRRLSDTAAALEPAVTPMGGIVSVGLETNTFQVELQLLAVEDESGSPGIR